MALTVGPFGFPECGPGDSMRSMDQPGVITGKASVSTRQRKLYTSGRYSGTPSVRNFRLNMCMGERTYIYTLPDNLCTNGRRG